MKSYIVGLVAVEGHPEGSFYFGKVGENTFYIQDVNVYKVRGQGI